MQSASVNWLCLFLPAACCSMAVAQSPPAASIRVSVTIDRGRDVGQCFGSLFEATSADGSLVIGAGFQNLYNTRYRADRHSVQLFVRSAEGLQSVESTALPRPGELCGTYLYSRDQQVYSTYGGLRILDGELNSWQDADSIGGTEETMRVGDGVLEFGDSSVKYNGRTILNPPAEGSYQLFFYANGHLCFYHVNRGDGPYRLFTREADGFSRLYACPWSHEQEQVDLNRAVTRTLPVVGETTFAWGQLRDQIVTGSNIGGFYVFRKGVWDMLLEPDLKVSYQLYSTMAFGDQLLMGQYPTGRLFSYDGQAITDMTGWPPKLDGVSASAREAQTTAIYAGELFVGVWPWGELWRYHPDSQKWTFTQRMFTHPQLSDQVIHPYDVENAEDSVPNQWGQRITSLVTHGADLLVATSAKSPRVWEPELFPFLAPDKWKSYGAVYRLYGPGHLGAVTSWTDGPTTLEFTISETEVAVSQDGRLLASGQLAGAAAHRVPAVSEFPKVTWGDGIYGRFGGRTVTGTFQPQR